MALFRIFTFERTSFECSFYHTTSQYLRFLISYFLQFQNEKKKNYLESNRDFSFNKLLRHLLRFLILLLVPLLFWRNFWRNRFPIYNDTHTHIFFFVSVCSNKFDLAIHSSWRMAIHWIWNTILILFECLNLPNKT